MKSLAPRTILRLIDVGLLIIALLGGFIFSRAPLYEFVIFLLVLAACYILLKQAIRKRLLS